jgi:uncharacterized protein YegJ (DUF2314 family)
MLDIAPSEPIEGDPDTVVELIPHGGSSREAWDDVVVSLFGEPTSVTTPIDDTELSAIAAKARRELPSAIKRVQAGEGELFVKGPFSIPSELRLDGSAPSELLWVAAASCDAKVCSGSLSNEPTYATNLAAGKTVSVAHAAAVDWLLKERDGGTVGGDSIKALKARMRR